MNDSRLTEQISIYILSKPYYFNYLRIDNINSSARQIPCGSLILSFSAAIYFILNIFHITFAAILKKYSLIIKSVIFLWQIVN